MRATTNNIINDWLKTKLLDENPIIYSNQFEDELVKYGEMFWGVKKLPSAYSRQWRKIRSTHSYRDIGIDNVRPVKTKYKSNEGVWELIINM